MTPKQRLYDILGRNTAEALSKRGFEAYYACDKAAALKKALELIDNGSSITWGGSASIDEIGLCEALSAGDYDVIDRSGALTEEEKKAVYRKAFTVDWYLGSANAISSDGIIVNIDGTGNRVAAMMYGPDNVLLIIGANKIEPDEDSALIRARNIAAPVNAARFGIDTPCQKTGRCMDCLHEKCICSYVTLTRKCKPAGRIKVIIVGEDIGF